MKQIKANKQIDKINDLISEITLLKNELIYKDLSLIDIAITNNKLLNDLEDLKEEIMNFANNKEGTI